MDTVIIDGLVFALPLFIIALGGIFSERSGIINLALEGFQGFGAFIGALMVNIIVLRVADDAGFIPYAALIFATLGGMAYAGLHALLCVKFRANQVISGVVINILGIAITAFLTSRLTAVILGTRANRLPVTVFPRFSVPILSDIPVLGAVFTNLFPFQVLIVILAIVAYYVLYKSKFGLRLRACGENPQAVDSVGLSVTKTRVIAVLISGGLAGFGGMCFVYSITLEFSPLIYMGFGFLSIAALVFGNWKIVPTFLACLIFGFARSGGNWLIFRMGRSADYIDLAMTLPYLITLILLVYFSKANQMPAALGEIYDKGKR